MQIYEVITKKKQGLELTTAEINAVVEGFTSGEIPDYKMSALLMAICLKGMTAQETTALTMAMANSGETIDLTPIKKNGKTIDKHSTGGVGDKTTLIVAPIIAAIGLPVAKMSGRGLGHTGGTLDKLESIPGLRIEFNTQEFLDIVAQHGICVAGQSGNLVPADKKMYALRDVTATVDSIPLIAASIMSKKIAAGADHILLDVKTGNGAFMKDLESAKALAQAMVEIGNGCGRKTAALITDMSKPLGRAIGNSLEIQEVVQVLANDENAPQDLIDVCVALASNMLHLVGYGDIEICEAKVIETLKSGDALEKFAKMVAAQGGDAEYVYTPVKFAKAGVEVDVHATTCGYITKIDTEGVGISAMMLGAGREKSDDVIDYAAGIIMHKTYGNSVESRQKIATLYTNNAKAVDIAREKLLASIAISGHKPEDIPLVHGKL